MYHAILIDQEFKDSSFPETFDVFNRKASGSWKIYGVKINSEEIDNVINKIQENLKEGTWYCHIYNDEDLIVVFKNKVFKVSPHESTWDPILKYGENLDIPIEQLDFWPNRFQDERHYFND